jgi:hypothetical protein
MDGWINGWMDVKAVLKDCTALSQKCTRFCCVAYLGFETAMRKFISSSTLRWPSLSKSAKRNIRLGTFRLVMICKQKYFFTVTSAL